MIDLFIMSLVFEFIMLLFIAFYGIYCWVNKKIKDFRENTIVWGIFIVYVLWIQILTLAFELMY